MDPKHFLPWPLTWEIAFHRVKTLMREHWVFSHLLDPFHGSGLRRVTCKVPLFRLICDNSLKNIFFERRKCIPKTNSEIHLKSDEKKVL